MSRHQNEAGSGDHKDKALGAPWTNAYHIQWMPKEFCLRLRQHINCYQLSANFEFGEMQNVKPSLALKPITSDWRWKLSYETKKQHVHLQSGKFALLPLFKIQLGLSHDVGACKTRLTWRIIPSFMNMRSLGLCHKTLLAISPGFDIRLGWSAHIAPPNINGFIGREEAMVKLNCGCLFTSIDKVEAIFTRRN